MGINITGWRTVVNNIETKNQAINGRLNTELSRTQNNFASLIEMLEHLEAVNKLVVRYRAAVTSDVRRLLEVGERRRQADIEAQGIFIMH